MPNIGADCKAKGQTCFKDLRTFQDYLQRVKDNCDCFSTRPCDIAGRVSGFEILTNGRKVSRSFNKVRF